MKEGKQFSKMKLIIAINDNDEISYLLEFLITLNFFPGA